MPKKIVSKKLAKMSYKIANLSDFLLDEDGHEWELEELHLVPKNSNSKDRIVCKYIFEKGKWVLKCTRP